MRPPLPSFASPRRTTLLAINYMHSIFLKNQPLQCKNLLFRIIIQMAREGRVHARAHTQAHILKGAYSEQVRVGGSLHANLHPVILWI